MQDIKPRSPGQYLLVGFVLLYALVLLVGPVVAMAQKALEHGSGPIIDTLSDPDVIHALELSFWVAFSAVIINTVFGLATAWVLVRQRFRGRGALNLLVDIPFVFSPVIAGYTLIVLFGRNGWLAPTAFPIAYAVPGIVLATIFVSLPFVTREVGPVLASLETEPEEAAYTMGASRWMAFRRIVLPNIWSGILYGVVLTLARALGEFGAVVVVGGGIEGRSETATMFIDRALDDRNTAAAYSIALLLGLVAVAVLLIMRRLQRRLMREQQADVDPTG